MKEEALINIKANGLQEVKKALFAYLNRFALMDFSTGLDYTAPPPLSAALSPLFQKICRRVLT